MAHPLVHIDDLRSRYAWPVIAVTILSFASFMVALSFIIQSIAEDRSRRVHCQRGDHAMPSFGIGGSLGFAWAGTVVGEGTKASYHSALWICVAVP